MVKIQTIKLVEKHYISKNNKYYDSLDYYCYMSKNLYNFANYHIRQNFIKNGEYLNYNKIDKLMKIEELKEDNERYISIDLGLDNLATLTNNLNKQPIIISGRKIKSINQYYNKQMSHYRSVAKRMNKLDYTKRMDKLTNKRNNLIDDLIHKASRKVVDYALSYGANTIIIGNNKDWKRNSEMSKKVNQNFISIPHQKLIQQIEYKAKIVGINVVITEESYTSGTSFLDGELPIKENYNKTRRVFRGLFVSNNGIKINSDVNGSLQIMKKVFPNAFSHGIEDYGFNPIRVDL